MQGDQKQASVKRQAAQEAFYDFPYHHVSRFREGFSQVFCDTWGINYISTLEFILNKLKSETFESLVDIGCGDGRLTSELTTEFPEKDVEGIDSSRRAVALAKAMNSGITFSCLDITTGVLPRRYDCGLLMEVLEHIPTGDVPLFLDGICSLINPDGFLYITVPHSNKELEEPHFQHFTEASLREVLADHFEVDEVVYFEKSSGLTRLLKGLLSNRLFILNNRRLNDLIYKYYKQHLFFCDSEKKCQRLFMKVKKRPGTSK